MYVFFLWDATQMWCIESLFICCIMYVFWADDLYLLER